MIYILETIAYYDNGCIIGVWNDTYDQYGIFCLCLQETNGNQLKMVKKYKKDMASYNRMYTICFDDVVYKIGKSYKYTMNLITIGISTGEFTVIPKNYGYVNAMFKAITKSGAKIVGTATHGYVAAFVVTNEELQCAMFAQIVGNKWIGMIYDKQQVLGTFEAVEL